MSASSDLLTFLFTDIEGSTRRWEADAQSMRSALISHDTVLRDSIGRHGGRLFKHTGDGVCAAFGSAHSAVDAAIAAQRELELPVRMGLATGDAEPRDGDYFGAVLNRAARVMAAGHGGQILLDEVTARLLDGIALADLGLRRLRDIAKPIRVFQVVAPGVRKEFPPLRFVDAPPGNLRLPTTSLIGRADELVALERALERHRLVTVTGVGGVGKTRLALEAAAHSAPAFPDGVWVVELASVSAATAVPEAVAAVLGVQHQPGMSLIESVAAVQEHRAKLVVLDNCEHVLDAAAEMIEALLARAPAVRVLATSRQALDLAGEQRQPLTPLTVTDAGSGAVALFVERARALVPDFDPAADEAVLVDICRRLDGIPLAIELAASRTLSMTAAEIRNRLDDRFRLLVAARRGAGRHQTLRQAVQWSYELLTDAERHVVDACSVFAGGFDLAAANAVAACDEDEYVTLGQLDALVRKSLVTADISSHSARYSMLETIREFARAQLTRSPAADAVPRAHSRHYARRLAEALDRWDGPGQPEVYAWLALELPNLRTAFRHAADHDDLDTAATIAVAAGFLGGWIEQHEPSTWAEDLIDRACASDHPRLAQLYIAASECYRTGRVDDALRYADAAVTALGAGRYEPPLYGTETAALGGTYITAGAPDRWLELCRARRSHDVTANPFAAAALVMALVTTGQREEALTECPGLLDAANATENPCGTAFGLMAYGYACRAEQPLQAYEALLRGLHIAHSSGNRMTESYLAVNLSTFTAPSGTQSETLDFLALAIHNFHDSGAYEHMVSPLGVLATHLLMLSRHEAAATLLGFAATEFARVTFPEIADTVAALRRELGDDSYEAFARAGADMSSADIARYALEQIDRARGAR